MRGEEGREEERERGERERGGETVGWRDGEIEGMDVGRDEQKWMDERLQVGWDDVRRDGGIKKKKR